MTPDLGFARLHITLLTGSAESVVTFQTFADCKTSPTSSNLARILHGTLAQHYDALASLSMRGGGVFVTVNRTDLAGRKEDNIIGVRSLFVDGDGMAMPTWALTPSFTCARDPLHWHAYWLVSDGVIERFTADQTRLIKHYGSDPKPKDLPRVMRLAGFPHQKDPANHAVYAVAVASGKTYTRAEVLAAHPGPAVDPVGDDQDETPIEDHVDASNDRQPVAWRGAPQEREALALRHAMGIRSVEGQLGSDQLMRVLRDLLDGFALDCDGKSPAFSRVVRAWNQFQNPPWSDAELAHKRDDVVRIPPKAPRGYLLPQEGDAWPPLISLDGSTPPEIPATAYPGWLGGMVAAVAESCEVPTELPGLIGLALASGGAARRYVVEVRPGYAEPINMWCCAAYPSGGRKTAVMKDMFAPIVKVERRLMQIGMQEHELWEARQEPKSKKSTNRKAS